MITPFMILPKTGIFLPFLPKGVGGEVSGKKRGFFCFVFHRTKSDKTTINKNFISCLATWSLNSFCVFMEYVANLSPLHEQFQCF